MLLCWCRNLSPFTHRTSIWLDRLLGTHVPWVKRRHASCFFPTPCLKFARSWLWEFFGLSGGTTFLIINIKKYSSQPSCVHIVSSSYYYARWNRRPPKPIININALKKEGINVRFSLKKKGCHHSVRNIRYWASASAASWMSMLIKICFVTSIRRDFWQPSQPLIIITQAI